MHLELVKLSPKYKRQFCAMMEEWTKNKSDFTPASIFRNSYLDFENYYLNLDILTPTKNLVCDRNYFAYDSERDIFVGAINIRLTLNEYLQKYGGHIGYGVRPSERHKGYGSTMLKLALNECKKLNLNKILITCLSSNVGSKKIILKNGGILENKIKNSDGEIFHRYWISL